MLERLIALAEYDGLNRLSLDTGRGVAFAAAIALYARFAFEPCVPFTDYRPDPHNAFMTRSPVRA